MKKIFLGSLLVATTLFGGDVLAVVNGVKIKKSEIDEVLKAQHITYDKLPTQYKKRVLSDIITQALLIQKAEKSGIEKSKEFKEELDKIKKQVALKLFLKKKLESFKISDKEIKNFYEKNRDIMFKIPSQIKARHILVSKESEALKLIDELKKIPQNRVEEKFIELAKKYSKGPSGKNGGELGWFNKRKMIPTFSEAAFKLNKGAFSLKPVKTRFGWHIIFVEDKKEGGYISLDKVKDKIAEQLKLKKLKNYIETIKKSANIEYK